MIYWGVYLRYKLITGHIVVCDRYLDDTHLDFLKNFPQVSLEKLLLWRMLLFVTPTADQSFLLWVSVSESIRRSKLKEEPFPDDKNTLERRLAAYLDENRFSSNCYIKLDCRGLADNISDEIITQVKIVVNRLK